MPAFPSSKRFTSLLEALGDVERERLWVATGIDVDGKGLDEEKFKYFKKALADYREFVKSAENTPTQNSVEPRRELACEACGLADENETYFIVPKCVRFCMRCTEQLVEEIEGAA